MRVIGATTEHTIYAYSERVFLIDEYLKVNDEGNGNPIAIVVESYRYESFKDASPEIQKYLKDSIAYIENQKDISVALMKIIEELNFPILPGTSIEIPNFSEIEELLIYGAVDKHFVLGHIKGTEHTFEDIQAPYDDLFMTFDAKKGELEKQKGIPFIMNHHKFSEYPHVGIFGGSGSGKSYALRVFCEEMLKKRIPSVILDPHYEMTFSEKTDGLNDEFYEDFSDAYEVFTVGEDIGIDFTELNAEELTTLLKFLSNVSNTAYSIIEAVFEKGESFTKFLGKIEDLKEAFDFHDKPKKSWDKDEQLDDDVAKLYERYRKKVPNATALQALIWRLNQLKSVGIFTKDISKVEIAIVNRKMAIIRGRDIHVKMLAEYMIKKLYSKRRRYKDYEEKSKNIDKAQEDKKPEKFPPFFFITDEAHNYASNEEFAPSPLALQLVQISQEARKYGVFLVLATQRPSSLNPTLFAQLNTKFVFRLTAKTDIMTIKTETNLSDTQAKRLPNMASGNSFISSALLKETTYMRFRGAITKSPHSLNPFDELDGFSDGSELKKILTKYLPLELKQITKNHSIINNDYGKKVSVKEIIKTLEQMVKQGKIDKDESTFGVKYLLR